jgi:hypothetical protein
VVFFVDFSYFFRPLAYNVPAVYDILPARIEKCVEFLGLQNVPEVLRGNERSE